MPAKRKTICLNVAGNTLTAVDSSGLTTTDAGIQGEDSAVWLHADIPEDWQDLTCRLQIIAINGNYDESELPVDNAIDMPVRQGVTIPGALTVSLIGSSESGIRRTADCRSLMILPSRIRQNVIAESFPQDFENLKNVVDTEVVHTITGSGGALVTKTGDTAYNINVTGTGGDMLQANYASGNTSNPNMVDVALAAKAAQAGSELESVLKTGWIPVSYTCTYASSAAFTVAADLSGILSVGDKIRLIQSGTTKYFYVIALSVSGGVTTVTVTGGSDDSLANAAISNFSFSKAASPTGFPAWFHWNPIFSASGSMTASGANIVASSATFTITGRMVAINLYANGVTLGGTADTTILISGLPVNTINAQAQLSGSYNITGTQLALVTFFGTYDRICLRHYNSEVFTLGSGYELRFSGSYSI